MKYGKREESFVAKKKKTEFESLFICFKEK